MRDRGFWPVFEGKSVDQWLVGTKPIRWWMSLEQAEAKYRQEPQSCPTPVWRDTARNTDARTCLAAVLPPRSTGSDTLNAVDLAHVTPDTAATVLNSFCFDFVLRMRAAGAHLSFTYLRPMPVPPAEVVSRLPRSPTLLTWESGLTHITADESLWPLLWDANRAVAQSYGRVPDDLGHILTTFPGVQKKRPVFFAYLLARLEEWTRGG